MAKARTLEILHEIELLPKEAQEKAIEFIEFLKFRYAKLEDKQKQELTDEGNQEE